VGRYRDPHSRHGFCVFIPISFYEWAVGNILSTVSITMASSIVISQSIALTLTPVLCAMHSRIIMANQRKQNNPIPSLWMVSIGIWITWRGKVCELLRKMVSRKNGWLWDISSVLCRKIYFERSNFNLKDFIPKWKIKETIYAIHSNFLPAAYTRPDKWVAQATSENLREIDGVESVSSLAGYGDIQKVGIKCR